MEKPQHIGYSNDCGSRSSSFSDSSPRCTRGRPSRESDFQHRADPEATPPVDFTIFSGPHAHGLRAVAHYNPDARPVGAERFVVLSGIPAAQASERPVRRHSHDLPVRTLKVWFEPTWEGEKNTRRSTGASARRPVFPRRSLIECIPPATHGTFTLTPKLPAFVLHGKCSDPVYF